MYFDLLNLYGENANVRALVKSLENHGQKVRVDFKSIEDNIKINDYDFIYLGSGLDEAIELVKKDLKKYKKDLKKYINDNKYILVTGNAIDALEDILNYKVKKIDFRIVGEQVFTFNGLDKLVIGFQNRNSVIYDIKEDSLFEVYKGCGYDPSSKNEGIRKNNLYATYLLGPILVRNPYLLEYFIKNLLESKNIKYTKIKKDVSYVAYEEYLKNFVYDK